MILNYAIVLVMIKYRNIKNYLIITYITENYILINVLGIFNIFYIRLSTLAENFT